MSLIRALVHGCWFNDHLYLRERDQLGTMIFRCQRCSTVQVPDLSQDRYRGSAHVQGEIPGKPMTKTIRLATKPTAVVATFSGGSKSAIARRK